MTAMVLRWGSVLALTFCCLTLPADALLFSSGPAPTGTPGMFSRDASTGHVIQEEGTDLPPQPKLNFVGPGVLCEDATGVTTCTVTGVAGLPDPGANGLVVRNSATPTTTNRSIAATSPLSATNADGVSGNPTVACPTCTTNASALTANLPVIGGGGQATAVGTRSGNTTEFATVTGTKTQSKQLAFDANGNVIASASDIGGGSGSGTVSSGLTGHLAVYPSDGTTVDDAANATLSAGALILGASGTAGSVTFGNATSGTVTLQPVAGALGTVTASLPAETGTICTTGSVCTGYQATISAGDGLGKTGDTLNVVSTNNNFLETGSASDLNCTGVAGTVQIKDTNAVQLCGPLGLITLGGSGTVDISGTPTAGQAVRWVDADTVEGYDTAPIELTGSTSGAQGVTGTNRAQYKYTIDGNITINAATSPNDGDVLTFQLKAAAASGNHTITWNDQYANGAALTRPATLVDDGNVLFVGYRYVSNESKYVLWAVSTSIAPILTKTAAYPITTADFAQGATIVVTSGSGTLTLPASPAAGAGQKVLLINLTGNAITIARNGLTINGAASDLTLSAASATAPTSAVIVADGTNYYGTLASAGAAPAFSALSSGSNTTATMTVGTGGSLAPVNSGTIEANRVNAGGAGIVKVDGSNVPSAAAASDVVALWTTCTGYLKSDATCDSGTGGGATDSVPAELAVTGDMTNDITDDVSDWAPSGITTSSLIRFTLSNGSQDIRSIGGTADGKVLWLVNSDTTSFGVLRHDYQTGTTASMRLNLPNKRDITIAPYSSVMLWYNNAESRWNTITTDQRSANVLSVATATTLTTTSDYYTHYIITALASDVTIAIPTHAATPKEGETLYFDITANASSHTITFATGTNGFAENLGIAAPTAIAANGRIAVLAKWSNGDSKWNMVFNNTGILSVAAGGTGADMSALGGTGHVVKQDSVGAAFTTGTLASTDLSDTTVIVRNNAGNTYSTGAQDFGSATSLKVPTGADAAPTASGLLAYDSTLNTYTAGVNTATRAFVLGFGGDAQNGDFTVTAAHFSLYRTISHTAATPQTFTLPGAGSLPPDGQSVQVLNYGAGTLTVTTTANMNGSGSDIVLAGGTFDNPSTAWIISSGGSNYHVFVRQANVARLDAANTFTSATGQSVTKLLIPGSSSGTLTIAAPAAAGTAVFTPPGATSDLSGTGGTGHVLKQATAGGAISSGTLACADLSDDGVQCGRGELSGAVVTSGSNATTLAAKFTTRACTIMIGDPGAASPVLANDNDSPRACSNDWSADWTITGVACTVDSTTGTPTADVVFTGGASILTGAISCGTSFVAGTLSGTPVVHSFSTGGATCSSTPCSLDVNITTAGGTAKYMVVKIVGTIPNN